MSANSTGPSRVEPVVGKATTGVRAGDRGIALIAVLWLVLLLSVIAGSLLMLTRTELGLSRNLVLSAQAQSLAEGGVQLAAHALLNLDPAARWIADGRPYRVEMEAGVLEITIQDVGGMVDLNAAPPELLAGLFQAVGMDGEEADTLADRLADWRDPDNERRLNGAEAGDYPADDGPEIRVGNAPFLTPDEAQRVPGMTVELWSLVAPVLTVYSRRPGVNVSTASRLALIAVPGIDERIADEIIAAREETAGEPGVGRITAATALATLVPAPSRRYTTGGRGNVFEIRSRAMLTDGGEYIQQAVIELTGRLDPPWRVHAWRPGEQYRDEAADLPS